MASIDTILDLILKGIADNAGAKIVSTGKFTGDDGDGSIEASDVVSPGTIRVRNDGRLTIGGRDTSGNYRIDFGSKEAADAAAAEFAGVLNDFRHILTLGDGVDDTDVLEQLLHRAAEALGGTPLQNGNFDGDDYNDGDDNQTSVSSVFVRDGDNTQVQIQGRDVTPFRYDFDNNATAEAFEDIAEALVRFGSAHF